MRVRHHAIEPRASAQRLVLARVVDDDDEIDDVVSDHFAPGLLDRVLGVVGRHHDHDLGLLRLHSL